MWHVGLSKCVRYNFSKVSSPLNLLCNMPIELTFEKFYLRVVELVQVCEPASDSCVRFQCNTLQHTATHCTALQHTATHCNTLQRTATHCNAGYPAMQCVTVCCIVLQCVTVWCSMVQFLALCCSTLQCVTVYCRLGPWAQSATHFDAL